MTKRKKQHAKTKARGVLALPIIIVVAVAIVLVCMIGYLLIGGKTQPEQSTPSTAPTELSGESNYADTPSDAVQEDTLPPETAAPSEVTEPDDRLTFMMEDGKIEIESVFQYTGLNPDCYWEDGRDVGAVVLINRSEEYLKSLDLTITLTDGTPLHFMIMDIPAGKTVWAYDTNNTSAKGAAVIEDVQYEVEFTEDAGLPPEQVKTSVEGMNVTLTNLTGTELSGIEVHCHSALEGVYFGGTSYTYPVDSLAAGASTVVVAAECFLGETEVTIVNYAN